MVKKYFFQELSFTSHLQTIWPWLMSACCGFIMFESTRQNRITSNHNLNFLQILAALDMSFLMPLFVAFLEIQGLRRLSGGRLRSRVNAN